MNKTQRVVLIGIGLIISAIQIIGINDRGLESNPGWAVSFLISAILLFIGFGSWHKFGTFVNGRPGPNTEEKTENKVAPKTAKSAPVTLPRNQNDRYEFGTHISELDIAIEAHKIYAEKTKLDSPVDGNGRSLNWNCCASVYASIRYAARKSEMRIHTSIWNTIIRAIVVRMSTNEETNLSIGDSGYDRLEKDAYTDIERINGAVEDALDGKGTHAVEPVLNVLSIMFGARGDSIKALNAMIAMNAEKAQKKILPELLRDFS